MPTPAAAGLGPARRIRRTRARTGQERPRHSWRDRSAPRCPCRPGGFAIHGLRCSSTGTPDRLAVVGAGTVGLLTALYAHDQGWTVTVVHRDGRPPQEAVTEAIPATLCSPANLTDNDQFDVVVDAAAGDNTTPLELALNLVRDGGAIVVQNAYHPPRAPPDTATRHLPPLGPTDRLVFLLSSRPRRLRRSTHLPPTNTPCLHVTWSSRLDTCMIYVGPSLANQCIPPVRCSRSRRRKIFLVGRCPKRPLPVSSRPTTHASRSRPLRTGRHAAIAIFSSPHNPR